MSRASTAGCRLFRTGSRSGASLQESPAIEGNQERREDRGVGVGVRKGKASAADDLEPEPVFRQRPLSEAHGREGRGGEAKGWEGGLGRADAAGAMRRAACVWEGAGAGRGGGGGVMGAPGSLRAAAARSSCPSSPWLLTGKSRCSSRSAAAAAAEGHEEGEEGLGGMGACCCCCLGLMGVRDDESCGCRALLLPPGGGSLPEEEAALGRAATGVLEATLPKGLEAAAEDGAELPLPCVLLPPGDGFTRREEVLAALEGGLMLLLLLGFGVLWGL